MRSRQGICQSTSNHTPDFSALKGARKVCMLCMCVYVCQHVCLPAHVCAFTYISLRLCQSGISFQGRDQEVLLGMDEGPQGKLRQAADHSAVLLRIFVTNHKGAVLESLLGLLPVQSLSSRHLLPSP